MSIEDQSEEHYITQQLEAIDKERETIEKQYDSGMISEKEQQTLLAKNEYLRAQVVERNQENFDKKQEQSHERNRDFFND